MTNKTRRHLNILKSIILSLLGTWVLSSCHKSSDSTTLIGNWVELSDFDGVPRSDAVGFTIGDKGYLGTGYNDDGRLKDFWEYDPVKNAWTQKADLPGVARNGAVGFGTDTKGYIGTGYDGENKLNDFWEFDPSTNTWTQKADFGGTARYGAIGMAINNKGYIGSGYDGNYLKDFWQYDPATDTWTKKVSIGGSKRRDASCFVIDGKGYVVDGIDNGTYENDFWMYDPSTDTWTEKRKISNATDQSYDDKYTSITGISKAAFAVNGMGYLVGGSGTIAKTVWEYDPVTDLWDQKTDLEGAERIEAVGFAIGTRGYVTTGRSSSYYFDDIWGFDPNADYNQYD